MWHNFDLTYYICAVCDMLGLVGRIVVYNRKKQKPLVQLLDHKAKWGSTAHIQSAGRRNVDTKSISFCF